MHLLPHLVTGWIEKDGIASSHEKDCTIRSLKSPSPPLGGRVQRGHLYDPPLSWTLETYLNSQPFGLRSCEHTNTRKKKDWVSAGGL